MTREVVAVTELERQMRDWIDDHTERYLRSGGADGHIIDMTALGGHAVTPTLLLRHIGKGSRTVRYAPVIYGCIGGNIIVIASRGGADVHPAWYLNIAAQGVVHLQIATQAFEGSWREATGEEKTNLWSFMKRIYSPYEDNQAKTEREIPVLIITPIAGIKKFRH